MKVKIERYPIIHCRRTNEPFTTPMLCPECGINYMQPSYVDSVVFAEARIIYEPHMNWKCTCCGYEKLTMTKTQTENREES